MITGIKLAVGAEVLIMSKGGKKAEEHLEENICTPASKLAQEFKMLPMQAWRLDSDQET